MSKRNPEETPNKHSKKDQNPHLNEEVEKVQNGVAEVLLQSEKEAQRDLGENIERYSEQFGISGSLSPKIYNNHYKRLKELLNTGNEEKIKGELEDLNKHIKRLMYNLECPDSTHEHMRLVYLMTLSHNLLQQETIKLCYPEISNKLSESELQRQKAFLIEMRGETSIDDINAYCESKEMGEDLKYRMQEIVKKKALDLCRGIENIINEIKSPYEDLPDSKMKDRLNMVWKTLDDQGQKKMAQTTTISIDGNLEIDGREYFSLEPLDKDNPPEGAICGKGNVGGIENQWHLNYDAMKVELEKQKDLSLCIEAESEKLIDNFPGSTRSEKIQNQARIIVGIEDSGLPKRSGYYSLRDKTWNNVGSSGSLVLAVTDGVHFSGVCWNKDMGFIRPATSGNCSEIILVSRTARTAKAETPKDPEL